MEPSIYLIKVNVALIVLYAFYKFSFSKDTFFRLRRGMLLLICATLLIYPFIDFSEWAGWNEHALGETITTVYNKLLPEVLVTATLPAASTEVGVANWQAGTVGRDRRALFFFPLDIYRYDTIPGQRAK